MVNPLASNLPVKPQTRKPIVIVIGIGGLAAIILSTIASMTIVEQFINPYDTSTINSIIVTVIIVLTAWFTHKKLTNI